MENRTINDDMGDVVKAVCIVTKLSEPQFFNRDRFRHLIDARKMAYAAIREIYGYPLSVIGRYFQKNHATIIHQLKKHRDLIEWDAAYAENYKNVLSVFNELSEAQSVQDIINEVQALRDANKALKEELKDKLCNE